MVKLRMPWRIPNWNTRANGLLVGSPTIRGWRIPVSGRASMVRTRRRIASPLIRLSLSSGT